MGRQEAFLEHSLHAWLRDSGFAESNEVWCETLGLVYSSTYGGTAPKYWIFRKQGGAQLAGGEGGIGHSSGLGVLE